MAKSFARRKFDKINALNADIDVGGIVGMAARRTKAKMADSWTKRTGTAGSMHNRKHARAIKRGELA